MASSKLSLFACLVICTATRSEPSDKPFDVREGQDVTLECRYPPQPSGSDSLTFYWIRTTPSLHDNVGIGEIALENGYKIEHDPQRGIYDLHISEVNYERDNGLYICRVKVGGSGRVYFTKAYSLVVLIPPKAPVVAPGARALAQESHNLTLVCSSSGGSPKPDVKWYRKDHLYPMEANVTTGKSLTDPTISRVTLSPSKDDDGAVYRCVVWNRALSEQQEMVATVELNVNYFPRVEVLPENPLRVEQDGSVTMDCNVDAKPAASNIRWTRNGMTVSSSSKYTVRSASVNDSGEYSCVADNGLERPGEATLYLDVQYPPSVSVDSKTYEAEEGGNVEIRCNVQSNPEPISIEWTLDGNQDFKQKSDTLTLSRVNAEVAGTYTCKAINVISTSDGKKIEKAGSASVAVLVRHKPGRARITPERPVAHEGTAVTLSCVASPPGWPSPQYRWYRESSPADGARSTVISATDKYTIASAHLGSEGEYFCQATNELGHGEMASVKLEVHQPPRLQSKLQLHMTKDARESDFSVVCSALGKPQPTVKWLKDDKEIVSDPNLYDIKTEVELESHGIVNVKTTLSFVGKDRPNTSQLLPEDRGAYTCSFENEVKKVDSTMHLKIEHKPIPINLKRKVAYDLSEPGELSCKIVAFPKPEFQWFFGTTSAQSEIRSDGHYSIETTSNGNDGYMSVLRVSSVGRTDYGDYFCKVKNSLGEVMPHIRLQQKSAPEAPRNLSHVTAGASYVTLAWEAGFDGGLASKYFIRYKRVEGAEARSRSNEQCYEEQARSSEWMEYDCLRANPCNVTRLNQYDTYMFKVKAVNTKGQSNYSNDITVSTTVDSIQPPEQVTYDPSTRALAFSAAATCLTLEGVAETLTAQRNKPPIWQVTDTIALTLSGQTNTFHEKKIDNPQIKKNRNSGRSFGEPSFEEVNPRVRVKLCLKFSQDMCSDYTEAEIGPSYIKEASALTMPTVVAIVVSCLVFLVFLALLFIFCRCKKHAGMKESGKDYEMDAMSPAMANVQNQAPPPYYPSGMENKALEHSMDLVSYGDDSKGPVYGSQSYGYHMAPAQPRPDQTMQNTDWSNMGYIENSYTNSNNGGSVNSQDSLWQLKMAAAGGAMPPAHAHPLERPAYGYDALGPAYADAYAPYPRLPQDTYAARASQNPSRQEYCSDPYAEVHKPKKRIDQHIESPYHEVSGLPEAYGGGEAGGEDKPPHLSLSYDESLESGYSTPNSRARRVIREIIV